MNGIAMHKTVQLSKAVKEQLKKQSEVKETLDVSADGGIPSRKMTPADMWNLRRKGRSASDMIRRWNLN